ncbi:MAG TPA: formylmethanofuran dehydrogenase subunit C [Burkholderiales bacterium]
MSALVLELREPVPARVDLRGVTPDRLEGLSARAIGAIEVVAGARPVALERLFAISGDAPGELVLRGATACLDGIGAGMRAGRIVVEGDAGDYVAQDMRAGEIIVRGNAGAYAASGMRGGVLRITGNAGDCLGAVHAGARYGLRGGTVIVHGNAGARAGERQRRGQILIRGDAGDWLGARMVAGTIMVLGRTGRLAGFGMRRGSLLLAQAPASLPGSFNESGRHHLSFLSLYLRSLHALDPAFAALDPGRATVRRFVGDRGCNGKGEVLVWL